MSSHCFIVLLIGLIVHGMSSPCPGNEASVSRECPKIYTEKLEAMLTPAREALAVAPAPGSGDEDAEEVLDEEIHFIEADGRRFHLRHRIYRAVTQGGVEATAEQIFAYRTSNQKIILVSADTILPDGSRIPVSPQASILQTPQRQADDAIYGDEGELRLIFSNVKPGVATEAIVLIEESEFRIPGEFTAAFSWAGYWPTRAQRIVVEMPAVLASRLKVTGSAHEVPEAEQIEIDERVRWTWKSTGIAARRYERNRAPTRQVGPALWLTTLPDWDAFGRWWGKLVDERSDLKPELMEKVDAWTKDVTNREEIVRILFEKVANDVRYVGLEFGAEDLQPHDCNEVWEKQYGDCKDKANLLRVMLKHKGIDSWLVLLNTEHAGLIEKRSPDYRQFNHAILAVEGESLVFCDPTIRYGKPGILAQSDSDREVLLVRNGEIKWSRTPDSFWAKSAYDFELKVAPSGEIAGWLTSTATGYFYSSYKNYFEEMDKVALRDAALRTVQAFYDNAELMDVSKVPELPGEDAYRLKIYFIVSAPESSWVDDIHLKFPREASLLYDLGPRKERETPMPITKEQVEVTARFALPPGCRPSALPRPLHLQSPAIDVYAGWTSGEGQCAARLDLVMKKTLVPSREFEAFHNAQSAIRAWLDKPLTLSGRSGEPRMNEEHSESLDDFPIMSSGDGQLELVEKRFPLDQDAGSRRRALDKVVQYFANDPTTVFRAQAKLAIMDWREDKNADAVRQFRKLIQSYEKRVTEDDIAWTEYVMALALRDDKKPEEALAVLDRLSGRTSISQERRGWAAYQQALLLEKDSADKALIAVEQGLLMNSSAFKNLFAQLAKLLLLRQAGSELESRLLTLVESKSEQLRPTLEYLIAEAPALLPPAKGSEWQEMMRILRSAAEKANLGETLRDELIETERTGETAKAAIEIKERLLAYLAKNPLQELPRDARPFKTASDLQVAVEQAEQEGKPDLSLRYAMEILIRFEPGGDFGSWLWNAVKYADWKERHQEADEELLPFLFELSDALPRHQEAYSDARLVRAQRLERKGELKMAGEILEGVLSAPDLPEPYKVLALARFGENQASQQEYEGALETFKACEEYVKYGVIKGALLRAIFLNLERNNKDEAFRIVDILAGCPETAIKDVAGGNQILEMIGLAKDRAKAAEYWEGSEKWWPGWLALSETVGLRTDKGKLVVPVIADLTEIGEEVGVAMRDKDKKTFFRLMDLLAHAARWLPSYSKEFASMISLSPYSMMSPHQRTFNELLLVATENFRSDDPELRRKNSLYAMIGAINLSKFAEAAEIARSFFATKGPNDPVSHAMARLWSMAAVHRPDEVKPSIVALEAALQAPDVDLRGKTVEMLADLYVLAGRENDETELLKRELLNPKIKKSPADLQVVEARLKRQLDDAGRGERLGRGIETWLTKWKPEWLDFAEPHSLDDERLVDLERVLKNPGNFLDPEVIKLNLLVARAATQPLERRENSFLSALNRLARLPRSRDDAVAMYHAVIADENFSEWLRIEALWFAILDARDVFDLVEMEKLAAHSLANGLSDRSKESLKVMKKALSVDRDSPEELMSLCELILQSNITLISRAELAETYKRLLQLGKEDLAKVIVSKLGDARVDPDANVSKATIQMELLSEGRAAAKWKNALTAMRKVLEEEFPSAGAALPQQAKFVRPYRLRLLPEETAREARLYYVKSARAEPMDYSFWVDLARDYEFDPARRSVVAKLTEARLRHSPGDAERGMGIAIGRDGIDGDDPQSREQFLRTIAEFRDPVKFPISYGHIREVEVSLAMRLGHAVDVERDLTPSNYPEIASRVVEWRRLSYWIQQENKEALGKYVDTTSADELLSDRMTYLSIRIFQLLDLEDYLTLAADVARKQIYKNVLESWAELDGSQALKASDLAEVLGDSSGLPSKWFECLIRQSHHKRTRFLLLARRDYLEKDWIGMLSHCEEAIKELPTYYVFYWYKAIALCYLGRENEAIPPLQTYAKYAKDEFDYPLAKSWLEEITKKAGATGAPE